MRSIHEAVLIVMSFILVLTMAAPLGLCQEAENPPGEAEKAAPPGETAAPVAAPEAVEAAPVDKAAPDEEKTPSIIVKDNNVTVNPIGLLLGGLNISYTRAFHDVVSGSFGFIYVAPLLIPAHGVGVEFALRFWPHRRSNNGWFLGPFVRYIEAIPTSDKYLGGSAVALGGDFGYRWLWNNGFNLGLGLGGGWAFMVYKEPCPANAICEEQEDFPLIVLLFDLGYAW